VKRANEQLSKEKQTQCITMGKDLQNHQKNPLGRYVSLRFKSPLRKNYIINSYNGDPGTAEVAEVSRGWSVTSSNA